MTARAAAPSRTSPVRAIPPLVDGFESFPDETDDEAEDEVSAEAVEEVSSEREADADEAFSDVVMSADDVSEELSDSASDTG